MIVGQPGAGKSRLARDLGRVTGLPVVHLDRMQWLPGWRSRDRVSRDGMMLDAARGQSWIIDGNYPATWATRLARADTLIVLDLPLWLRAWRVSRRTIAGYGRTRPDLAEGCPDKFDPGFWAWIWQTRASGRAEIRNLAAHAGPDTAVHHLTGPRAVRGFLSTVSREEPAPGPDLMPSGA